IAAVPIIAPLPDVAVHIVKAPGVGWKATDRRCLFTIDALLAVAIDEVAVVIRLIRIERRAEVIGRRRPGPARVFPLRLRRQAIWLLVLGAQLFAERLAIVPGNLLDRQVLL